MELNNGLILPERRQFNEDLKLVLEKLERIEAFLSSQCGALLSMSVTPAARKSDVQELSAEQQVLFVKLGGLTLKRHAVLIATLGEKGYKEIADVMKCSETTVKLHLKAAMTHLGISDRSMLLSQHKQLLSEIPDDLYVRTFGISKTWYMEDIEKSKPHLYEVLTSTKPAANQHTEKA